MALGFMVVAACEGPAGPPGLEGPPGPPGGLLLAEVEEIVVNFNEENDFTVVRDPADSPIFPIEDSDVVLFYLLWETTNDTPPLDIWRPVPQNIFFPEGVLVYNADFTREDYSVFLEGTINPLLLGPEFTQNQVFRVVVLPSQFLTNGRIDVNDYDAVMKLIGNPKDEDIPRFDLTK
ncbi:hypothetical protein [Nitritalea halalkaliphila]|nr:hypothetical protein [Nitritalea halalkaliphila]